MYETDVSRMKKSHSQGRLYLKVNTFGPHAFEWFGLNGQCPHFLPIKYQNAIDIIISNEILVTNLKQMHLFEYRDFKIALISTGSEPKQLKKWQLETPS